MPIQISMAQQPSYFILGEEELSGINIYDIHEDNQNNYWIATNNGIYKYDCYKIQQIHCPDMTSSSVFNFIEDYNHNVYCHNLSGQIFQMNENSCQLYFTIPDSMMTHEMSYEFDNLNQLTISTNRLFQVSSNKEITKIFDKKISSVFKIYKDIDSNLVYYSVNNQELLTLKNGVLLEKYLPLNKLKYPQFTTHGESVIVYVKSTGEVLPELSSNYKSNFPKFKYHNNLSRYYSDNTNFWVSNLSGGVYLFDENLAAKNNYEPLFENEIISILIKDKEGNILLGTFGSGIIIIPNLDIQDIIFETISSKITKLTSSPDGSIFFGNQEGEIYKISKEKKITRLKEKGIQQIEFLEYLPNLNSIVYNGIDHNFMRLDPTELIKLTNVGSIKDITEIDTNGYLFATNKGVSFFDIQQLKSWPKNKINIEHIISGRSYCIGYNSETKTIYNGTSMGLKIGNQDKTTTFKLFGKSIIAHNILNLDNNLIVTTKNNGALVFKNDSLIDNWSFETGLLSNNCKIIKEYNGSIYLSTSLGLNILTKHGKVLNSINKSNGLNSNNIVDFEVLAGYLWILTNKGIQKIKLDKITNANFTPSIKIARILVNEKLIDSTIHDFDYYQKKFIFEIFSKSLKYQNDIKYEYQLAGIDQDWVSNSYLENKIEYKSLPPNHYTFNVKAIHKFNESEIISYSFTIKKPYWERWWFYLASVVIFLTLTFIVYRIQLRRQRKKTRLENQLSLTQLTALKSQMNPHFIFNSLNSIQDLILKQDRENAYNYISKFALLVRKILNHSDKAFIDIEEEIKVLSVYLELEELRFKKDFTFNIESNGITDLEIPPMLIQPFIENALKHGLLHKKGDKVLSVIFKFINQALICEITDNGIGRVRSQEIKERQHKGHESFSIKSIANRFEILKNLYDQEVGVTFEDLEVDNKVAGTKVILKIPFKRRF